MRWITKPSIATTRPLAGNSPTRRNTRSSIHSRLGSSNQPHPLPMASSQMARAPRSPAWAVPWGVVRCSSLECRRTLEVSLSVVCQPSDVHALLCRPLCAAPLPCLSASCALAWLRTPSRCGSLPRRVADTMEQPPPCYSSSNSNISNTSNIRSTSTSRCRRRARTRARPSRKP